MYVIIIILYATPCKPEHMLPKDMRKTKQNVKTKSD